MLKTAWVLYRRDMKIAFRARFDIFLTLMFQIIVIGMFPLALSNLAALTQVGVGYIWVTLLLAMLLGSDLLFKKDAEDGSLALLRQTDTPLWCLVLAKITCHFTCTAFPLIIFTPLYGLLLNLPVGGWGGLMLSLTVGALSISTVLALGAALGLLARGGAAFQVLLGLPLLCPVIILGPQAGENPGAFNALLALACFFVSLFPALTAFVLEQYDE